MRRVAQRHPAILRHSIIAGRSQMSAIKRIRSVCMVSSITAMIGVSACDKIPAATENAALVSGPPIEDVVTSFDDALSCLSGKFPAEATFAVAAVADNTGKEGYADSGTGKMVTQGAGDIVQSALFKAGVRVVNRRDPNIPIVENNWGIRTMKTQTPAAFYISGSIDSLDFIPGGGAELQVAGVGPRYRQTRILIGLDLALTNSYNGEVIANIPLQKQIFADESGFSTDRFFGTTLVALDAGGMRREALHFALRQMLSLATFELLAQVSPAPVATECAGKIVGTAVVSADDLAVAGRHRVNLAELLAASAAGAMTEGPPATPPAPNVTTATTPKPNSPEALQLAASATSFAARAITTSEDAIRAQTYEDASKKAAQSMAFTQLAAQALRQAAAAGLNGPEGDAAATVVQQAIAASQLAQTKVSARTDAPPAVPTTDGAAAPDAAPATDASPLATGQDKRLGGAGN
ncbi:CsgG/HfaB family protein [Limimaricola sp.]|uniref:CsgG/HfaB family protein n=1 Tax=Limimaricola sp. TaxID=2211665 RepID=UPI0025BC692B|nr:CsgG/HfaB family protein [Limimaricola sp.]